MSIKTAKEEVYSALSEIKKFQQGLLKPIKTRRDHLNDNLLGGLYPNSVISIGGLPGSGKSWNSQEIEEDMFNPILNPHHEMLRLVRCNFEMIPRDILIRRIIKSTDLDIDELLSKEHSEFINNKIREIAIKESDPRIFYYPETAVPETLAKDLEDLLKKFKADNPMIHTVISIDHIALVKSAGDKKQTVDKFLGYLNILKKNYLVTFLILSQLNREIKKRSQNPMEHSPRTDDFYQSDEIYQLSDYQIVIHRPEMLGIDQYMAFKEGTGTQRFPWLEGFMQPDKRSFKTEGLIFWHYLKFRHTRQKREPKTICIEVLPGYRDKYASRSGATVVAGGPPIPDTTYRPPTEPSGTDISDLYR